MAYEGKAGERFEQVAEGTKMIFIPQCCRCKVNIDKFTCALYYKGNKPTDIMANIVVCKDLIER